jgi:hypothetical protein
MDETAQYPKQAWVAWEKLRIVYNLLLLVQGLTCEWFLWQFHKITDYPLRVDVQVTEAIVFGVLANLFYCLGPAADVCVYRILRWRMGLTRHLLFAAGLLFSMWAIFLAETRLWSYMEGYLQ